MSQDPKNTDELGVTEEGGQKPPYFLTFSKVFKLSEEKNVTFNPAEEGGGGEDGGGGEPPVKPKYRITFNSAYRVTNNRIIRFNRDDYVPVDPALKGELVIHSNISVTGSLFLEPRPSVAISGEVALPQTIALEGLLTPYRLARLSGSIAFSGFEVEGSMAVFTPYYLGGEITLSSQTYLFGEIKYDDDTFRGISNSVSVDFADCPPAVVGDKVSYFRISKKTDPEFQAPFMWGTPTRKAYTSFYEDTLPVRGETGLLFNYAVPVAEVLQSWYADGVRLNRSSLFPFNDAIKLPPKTYLSEYIDMIRLRNSIDAWFRNGVPISDSYDSVYQWAIKTGRNYLFPFAWASKIIARFVTVPVVPPKYEQPKPGDYNIRFNCPYRARNRTGEYNIYFNMTRCKKPYRINSGDTYMVENTCSARRVADDQAFEILKVDIDTDIASWCWGFNAVIPESELDKVKPLPGELPLLEFTINGDKYVCLVESINRSRKFGSVNTYTLKGRSISALLDEPHSDPITYTNESDMSAVQLIQQLVADCVGDVIKVQWENLVSDIGWVLPAHAVNITGKSVIKAIAEILEPVGGIVFTHPSQEAIVIKKAYPYAHWENPLVLNHILAEDIVTDEGTEWDRTSPKNAVFVTDSGAGNTTKVLRRGTAGDKLAPEVVSPILSTELARQQAGKAVLIEANIGEVKSMSFPFLPMMNHIYPAETLMVTSETGEEWGTITSVSLSASASDDGMVNVAYSVSVKRFMETGLYA